MERHLFRRMLRERRAFPPGSPDWNYRTRAARTYLDILRRVPTTEWRKQ
jgi:hypothetical protein